MSEENKSYELKSGLTFITERSNAFGYSDLSGDIQYIHPVSRYKAFTEIKRGEVVSVVTKDDLENLTIDKNKVVLETETFESTLLPNKTITKTETLPNGISYPTYTMEVYSSAPGYGVKVESYYENRIVDEEVQQTLINKVITTYATEDCLVEVKFPIVEKETVKYEEEFNNEDWINDTLVKTTTYNFDESTKTFFKDVWAYSKTKFDEVMEDPDPYVIKTNTAVHERSIGIAMDYAEGYGSVIHVQPYGKFVYDPKYEGVNEDFYGETAHTEVFDHTKTEYNPGFTYKDVGKKVYVAYEEMDGSCGHLTVDEEAVSKFYHNIICIGYLTDAPQNKGEGKTEIEISISGDQRGLLDSTQFEARLGEDVTISSKDPVRVFAIGKESDTKFKARLCLTPQAGTFNDTDFIAFQKMDGNTSIVHFTPTFNLDGVIDNDDNAFLHMAKCYADINTDGKISTRYVKLNDTQTTEAIGTNINTLYVKNSVNVLGEAFNDIAGYGLNVEYYVDHANPFGYLDLEAKEVGGYYVMYISSGVLSKFSGSVTTCRGSYENHGLAVLADIRIPERRDILGIYYGTRWDEQLEKGYTTIFMRMGEFDVPEVSKQVDGNFKAGQEYYLGTNGRVVKYPYNQYDFVNKIGTIKYSNNDDLRFVVDIGSSTRHYNGDLPVGYMKPAVRVGTEYAAEYGFLLMDGTTTYSKEAPYDAIYERLLGWFDPNDVNVAGSDMFKVPAVSRMVPDEVTVTNEDGTTSTVSKQVQVPMQIKFLATGIYEEMPRIPFKRFFGTFAEDGEKVDDDWTPVKCQITDCDITDIVDYGISEDGYTKPGLDNLDIHLFIDPNEDYVSGPHDWHEVHEGFINWNNSTTFGFTWVITEEDATLEHPYGCYKLSMNVGKSEGVAYVTDSNQAPKKLNGCYYKLYVARREVFSRQFDIEKIYKDYLTDSIFTDDAKTEVVLDRAVTGKAVLDAINNRYSVDKLWAREGGDIEIGPMDAPVNKLILNTTSKLPIISKESIVLQNEYDNESLTEDKRASKVVLRDGVLTKEGAYDKTDMLSIETVNGKNNFKVENNIIPTVEQVRGHATATIDNKDYLTYYSDKDNDKGKIHGMVFGKGGNINASTLWGYIPKISSGEDIESKVGLLGAYIPVAYKTNTGWETVIEGKTQYRDSDSVILEKDISKVKNTNYTLSSGIFTQEGQGTTDAVKEKINLLGESSTYVKSYLKNDVLKALETIDLDNGTANFLRFNGNADFLGGLNLYAGSFNSASRSEFKRIHGELIRDDSLVSDKDLAEGSKKYDENKVTETSPSEEYPQIVYKIAENTNKLKSVLGSALQAAYEMPLAYWQYNTEKEWYKDRLGVIVQRIESVAENIKGKKFATATIGSLIVTANSYENKNISIKLTRVEKTDTVTVETLLDGDILYTATSDTVGGLESNELVTFSGVEDAKLLIPEIMDGSSYTVALENGSETGTERKLFDKLYDTNGDDPSTTTPAEKATITIGNLKVTAREEGKEGNSIYVKIEYLQENSHYQITVKRDSDNYEAKYWGKDIDELHTPYADEVNPEPVNDKLVTFEKIGDDAAFEVHDNEYLKGGADGEAITRHLINTDYKENTYQYTEEEATSIKEYLTTIIDNSSNGQDIISTVGMLLNAAKETQERLLRVEASTFGRDYETIPGNHEPYKLSGMPGVVPDPTNYGLNRLIRAICQELYYDSNPFDSSLANGGEVNTSSFSRIDRIDREIHGELNTEDGVQTAPNKLSDIDSTTYPYEDMIRASDDTEIREAEFTMEDYDETAKERGTNIKTRVDMSMYNKNFDGDYVSEIDSNVQDDSGHFNGIVDAIYRITTKLNALTESINNSDNIADSPKRLNTIRQNIEHIIREAYFDDAYVMEVSTEKDDESSAGEDRNIKVFETISRTDATPYHDVNGPENAPYQKNLSRFDKLTNNLYNYTISVSGEGLASFQDFKEFGDEKVINQVPVRDEETGEVKLVDTETQVYYTGRKFNGKHLLVDNKPSADGTDASYTAHSHVPQNLNDYDYATLLDIVVDAIGAEAFRKNVSKKEYKDDAHNNISELRHNKTISERLDSIEACLDKVVGKLSRQHSFEMERDISEIVDGKSIKTVDNSENEEEIIENRNISGSSSPNQTVFSIDRYLQFINDYLGYYQTTSNDLSYGNKDYDESNVKTDAYTTTYTEHWANGVDVTLKNTNSLIDGDPTDENFNTMWASKYGESISNEQYSAEWAFKHRRNIHAGLVNVLSRLQNEEARSTNWDAILGPDFASIPEKDKVSDGNGGVIIDTSYIDADDNNVSSVKTQTATAIYNLTDDIADLLKTIYGTDNHDKLQENNKGSFTSYVHRTIVDGKEGSTNTNVRFVSGDSGNNIVDAIINELYFLPRPIRPYSEELDKTLTDTDEYWKASKATNATLKTNSNVFVETDNSVEAYKSANGAALRDSRLATYYDFEDGHNFYDIPNEEYALSWDNRDEFFNELKRPHFKDTEIKGKTDLHYRLSRFEVIENEIRNLRKLIGLDFGKWNGEEDLINLKFNGTLKFFGDRVNNGFNGNPFGTDTGSDGVNSYTDQFNAGDEKDENGKTSGTTTNILKFILNADKSERLLRAELGFSDPTWAQITVGVDTNKLSGFDLWYDYTYSTEGKETEETLVSSNVKDGETEYSSYGLFKQKTDGTYKNRHSVYDRLLALEQNAVRVDAWLDSVKNIYRSDIGKNSGNGNIFDIVNYIGNYTWDSSSDYYYGKFGELDKKDLRLSEKTDTTETKVDGTETDTTERYTTITGEGSELEAHHEAIKEIFDIIGRDENVDSADSFVTVRPEDKDRTVKKANTLWARLNAVETLNKNDVDITNVVSVDLGENTKNEDGTDKNVIDFFSGKDGTIEITTKMLSVSEGREDKLVTNINEWKTGTKEIIASKGYVDNKIVAEINRYHEIVDKGDEVSSEVEINDVSIYTKPTEKDVGETEVLENDTIKDTADLKLKDETVSDYNEISLENESKITDEQDYYNAQTTLKVLKAINIVNEQTQKSLNNTYSNLNSLMEALNYTYDEDVTETTTGSLFDWGDNDDTQDTEPVETEKTYSDLEKVVEEAGSVNTN